MSSEEHIEEVVAALDEDFYGTDVETTCTICQAEFLDAEDLTVHLHQIHNKVSTGSKLCWFCSYYYTDLLDFAEHFRDKHLTDLFYCRHCLRAFSDEDDHMVHEKKHKRASKNTFCCSQCCEKFGNIRDLRKHDLEEHNNNNDGIMMLPHLPYLSSVLNVKAETVIFSLHTDTVYICVACSYSTGDIHHFIKHSATGKCKSLVCEKCSNVYKKRYTLHQHVAKYCEKFIHTYKKVNCPDCKLTFTKYEFLSHKRQCKAIKCYTCNIDFDSMYKLSEHQSSRHPLSVELKACTFCWKQCVGSVALEKHINRSHKAEFHLYKYMCVYCKTPFKHPQKLFGHFFTQHKDLEPYTCKICSKKFRLRKRFTLHIKLNHQSQGFVEFDENYNVFFTNNKSEKPFIPKSLFENKEKKDTVHSVDEDSNMTLFNMNSEISVTETEGNQTEVEVVPKPTLKRKRGPKARKKVLDETITIESSGDDDDDESLLVVKKRALKQQKTSTKQPRARWSKKKLVNNKKRFTCNICNKYCYTFQNYNHHVSLHSKKDFKKCIKCSKVFKSKEKLNNHIMFEHSSSKLTDTLKYMLEKRKKGESTTDDLPMSEKFRRTIKKVECEKEKVRSCAKITEVDNRLSVQKFIENFTPEAENKVDVIIHNAVSMKIVYGVQREPAIKMTKFEAKPAPTTTKLSMPVKFKPSQCEKASATIKLVQPVPLVHEDSQDNDFQNYDDENYNFMDRNESIPEVAEEVMLEGSEEAPRSSYIPHKIVLPKLPAEYKDLRIAHLLPEAPYYKIVKVNEVLNQQNDSLRPENSKQTDIKLPDGTKLVNTNPLAHLLGKTPLEKVLEPLKNKYYTSKPKNFQGMLAEALSKLEKPTPRKKREIQDQLGASEVEKD